MATITTRAGKGSPLTNTEVDNNFTNLNTAKYESGNNVSFGTVASGATTITSGTAVGLTVNHDTFKKGLILHRNHADHSASIVFKNNSGLGGVLYGSNADGHLYYRMGAADDNNKLWHAGNDGSGSGLDADTLDGIQASSFLRSDATDTMTSQLIMSGASPQIKFNDTTSSADDFWVHVNSNNFYVLTDRDADGAWDGTYPLQLTNGTSTISSYGNTVWTSGNDGSGSGLDADTLDGLHSTSFVQRTFKTSCTNAGAGWYRVANSQANQGRGAFEIRFYTNGGTNAPGMTLITGTKGYGESKPKFISVEHCGDSRRATKVRGVHGTDGKGYIEVYLGAAYTNLHIEVSNQGNGGFVAPTSTTLVAASATNTAVSDEIDILQDRSNFVGEIAREGHKVWDAGNDGSGSGLDADTVDGVHGTALALRSETALRRLFTTSVAKGNFVRIARVTGDLFSTAVRVHFQGTTGNVVVNSVSDILVNHSQDIQVVSNGADYEEHWIKIIVDGNNQNFDLYFKYADNESNSSPLGLKTTIHALADDSIIPNPDGTTYPAYTGSNTYEHHIKAGEVRYGQAGGNNVDVVTDGNFYSGSNKVWHAGNDGASSGLDADTVDGKHASDFALAHSHPYASSTHNHDSDYLGKTATAADSDKLDGNHASAFTSSNDFKWRGTNHLTSTTTSALKTELLNRDVFDSSVSAFKTGWSYAGNADLTDAGRLKELAGTSWLTWTDNSADNTQGRITALVIAPTTGGSANKAFIYNDQGSGYAPGWREIWTSTSDGSGSGLDADTVDGIHGANFLRSDADDSFSGALTSTARDKGIFGNYDSSKTDQIWSIGTSYKNASNGSNFGNLYGAAYKHTNNSTGGNMAGGHQFVWCQNGTPNSALGTNIWTTGNVTAYSDIRVKTNIERIPDALDKVSQLNGYTFDRTDVAEDEEPLRQTGVIAQEVLEVLPEAVTGDEEGHYSVAYGNMVGLLIEAVKELKAEIEELKGGK